MDNFLAMWVVAFRSVAPVLAASGSTTSAQAAKPGRTLTEEDIAHYQRVVMAL